MNNCKQSREKLFNNSTTFYRYNENQEDSTFRVVGFEVIPVSLSRASITPLEDGMCTVGEQNTKEKITEETTSVLFTYQVKWEVCNVN